MYNRLKGNKEFREKYFDVLKYRLSYSSLEIEGIDEDLAEVNQSMKIYSMISGLDYILDTSNESDLSHYDFTNMLCTIENRITNGEINNFRTTNVIINGSKVKRSEPSMIRNDLWYLIDDYNYRSRNCTTDKERFELEAWFHIRLLHIHPFEDGNGRTARLMLTYNLMRFDLAPIIITGKTKEVYCEMIENSNVSGLAEMFESLSNREKVTMDALYNEFSNTKR